MFEALGGLQLYDNWSFNGIYSFLNELETTTEQTFEH